MISIVICSRKKCIDPLTAENIAQTIGAAHEIIIIDNSSNEYSIYEAYNKGITSSIGEIICLMHDDIRMHTADWGKIALRLFDDHPEAGLIGVAGSRIKTRMPSAWWNCPQNMWTLRLLQHRPNNIVEEWNQGFNDSLSEVAIIDGVFMLLRKNSGLRMNSQLQGFHGYDLALSLDCFLGGYRVYVTAEILLEHFSEGALNDSWLKNTCALHRLYRHALPRTVPGFDDRETLLKLELSNGKQMIQKLQSAGSSRATTFRLWWQLFLLKPISRFHWDMLKQTVKDIFCFPTREGS